MSDQCLLGLSGVFIVNFTHHSHLFLLFLLFTLGDERYKENEKADLIYKCIVSIGLGIHFRNIHTCLKLLEVLCFMFNTSGLSSIHNFLISINA